MTSMTFDAVLPVVEGKLYAYAMTVLRYPGTPISSVYDKYKQFSASSDTTSPQERWAVSHANELHDAAVIERVIRTLPKEELNLIRLRYVERHPWHKVAETLHVSRSSVYRIRDRAIMLLAKEFGLLVRIEAPQRV